MEVSPEQVSRALRTVRSSVYVVEDGAAGPTIMLRLATSSSGRRNAAERIVAALAEHGLELGAQEPVAALAAEGNRVRVDAASRPSR